MTNDGKSNAPPSTTEDWREIAERASNEVDPERLIALVRELCNKLDEREAQRTGKRSPDEGRSARAPLNDIKPRA